MPVGKARVIPNESRRVQEFLPDCVANRIGNHSSRPHSEVSPPPYTGTEGCARPRLFPTRDEPRTGVPQETWSSWTPRQRRWSESRQPPRPPSAPGVRSGARCYKDWKAQGPQWRLKVTARTRCSCRFWRNGKVAVTSMSGSAGIQQLLAGRPHRGNPRRVGSMMRTHRGTGMWLGSWNATGEGKCLGKPNGANPVSWQTAPPRREASADCP